MNQAAPYVVIPILLLLAAMALVLLTVAGARSTVAWREATIAPATGDLLAAGGAPTMAATAPWPSGQRPEAPTAPPRPRRPLMQIGHDAYLAWVDACDAPAGWVMTAQQARDRGWDERAIQRAEQPDGEVIFNRAGPGERCLTVAALQEAYADEHAHRRFRLTTDRVQPLLTSGRIDPTTGQWDDHTPFHDPWPPSQRPATLPDGWPDRF